MRVLVACEFSGIVRDAFAAEGHDAWSCDLLSSERPGNHIEGDVRDHLAGGWDLIIAHPPCTRLAVSGARWFAQYRDEQDAALGFFLRLLNAPAARVAVENPVSIVSSFIRRPDQVIQPWQFGHGETKATCLWLRNLPLLQPTDVVDGREPRVHYASPGPERWKERSRTLPGIARAMAQQWGSISHAAGRAESGEGTSYMATFSDSARRAGVLSNPGIPRRKGDRAPSSKTAPAGLGTSPVVQSASLPSGRPDLTPVSPGAIPGERRATPSTTARSR